MTATITDTKPEICQCADEDCDLVHEGQEAPAAYLLWMPENRKGSEYPVESTEDLIIELTGQGITNFTPWQRGEQLVKVIATGKIHDTVDILADNPDLVARYGR